MTDYNHSDKELTFENTPLQNLRNILSSAEASITAQEAALHISGSIKALGQEHLGVAKHDIRKAMQYLQSTHGKYVSAAVIGRIASQLCAPEDSSFALNMDSINKIYTNLLFKFTPHNTSQES